MASSETTPGRLVVIAGCMFAGKTTRLIELLAQAAAAGRRVLAFKHLLDHRYDPHWLVTHDGRTCASQAVADPQAILAAVARESASEAPSTADPAVAHGEPSGHGAQPMTIAIDEAHFFGPALAPVCLQLRDAGHEVLVAGIDFDVWGQPIAPLPQLKPLADDVVQLRAPCAVCGAPAPYSQRLAPLRPDDDMVGGPGMYEPRCERCFTPLQQPTPAN